MLHSAIDDSPARTAGMGGADYGKVRSAIAFLTERAIDQPGLDELARYLGERPEQVQRLFKRWCGLSPKDFLQALTLDHARRLLSGRASLLDTAVEVGLSGTGRLHDLFITHEAMTPGDHKRRGAGLTITYGFHASPFGEALLMATDRGLNGLAFVDEDKRETRADALADMMGRWPEATFLEDAAKTRPYAEAIFGPAAGGTAPKVKIVLIGTDFEVRVWECVSRIPVGAAVSYQDIARHLGKPAASRAVGSAVGRNPISFVVPCHRVLRADGGLGGYHWGLTRKRALIGWEKGWLAAQGAKAA